MPIRPTSPCASPERAASKGSARYDGADLDVLGSARRGLVGALAVIDCDVEEIIERHSHGIILGAVRDVRRRSRRRRRARLRPRPLRQPQPSLSGIDCRMSADSRRAVFNLHPDAHRIASDAEAIRVAQTLAAEFAVEAADRDRTRRLPAAELDRFSGSGLWGITVPKAYGGAGVSLRDPGRGDRHHLGRRPLDRPDPAEPSGGARRDPGHRQAKSRSGSGSAACSQGYRLGNAFSEKPTASTSAPSRPRLAPRRATVLSSTARSSTPPGALFAHFIHIGARRRGGPRASRHRGARTRRASPSSTTGRASASARRRAAMCDRQCPRRARGRDPGLSRAASRPSSNGCVSQIIQAAVDARHRARRDRRDDPLRARPSRGPGSTAARSTRTRTSSRSAQIGDLEVKLHAAEALLEHRRPGHRRHPRRPERRRAAPRRPSRSPKPRC